MRALVLLSCVTLAACAQATVQERVEAPIERRSFEIAQPYPHVYRAILNQARKCFHGGYTYERLYVGGDLYYDLKSGRVSVEVHGPDGIDVYMGADISAAGESKSTVEVMVGLKLWEGLSADVEGWARGTSQRCPPRDIHGTTR